MPAILADPIADGTGISRTAFYAIFSGSLLLSAVLGPAVGRAIDRRGGRGVLAISNIVFIAGLVLIAFVHGFEVLALAALAERHVRRPHVGGRCSASAVGLYEPAFATLTGLYGRAARGPITGVTLIAGFASTVGWPLSTLLNAADRCTRHHRRGDGWSAKRAQ